ncbi:MAG TPA: betaine/proline/choline family ABC transporter ATP-binding protein [Treponema sp.]|nr:betaine/proline/choline family ABC transporter ATP-binding protein [Treponema sp.]
MIEFKKIEKSIKGTKIIKGIDMVINKGELVVFVGPSGCGKTTCLKMINKLINPTSGFIFIDKKNIAQVDAIELRRNIGYVIQQTGLFPHMTVRKNIGIVPTLEKWSKEKIEERTVELLHMVGMKPELYLDRYPNELSGGQQQRIGVARAFANDPDVILMDEPFSALDPITRNQLQDELYMLQQKFQKTIVFVTHDISEALKLGDKICIMKDGKVLQYDTPETILKDPQKGFVEEFIGKNRIWETPEFINVKDIMITDPVKTVKERTAIQGLQIMKNNKVDSLLIVDADSKLIGIVSSKTIRKSENKTKKLSEIMSVTFSTTNENDNIVDVIKEIVDKHHRYIPVVNDENILTGIVTRSSLIEVIGSQYMEGDESDE